jgi:hypothetical protein
MQYKDLDSKQRANYWNLMYVCDVIDEYGGNLARAKEAQKSIHMIAKNLKIELFTDPECEEVFQ